ncbi:acyltransferase family protein [Rubritalea marina]|uniref:acyltransferase family protein n=1 Tax=Rubritalea marina TaxID=361055 RepID=UPI00037FF486|nr:acyltransferase family protein [Rubritalea marina]
MDRYRVEIDGLRGISVLAVLLFHVGGILPGGFVGVDIFFVISGYLIMSIILRDLQNGTFSIQEFWVRRIRRIAPAALVMCLVTVLIGYFILLPKDYFSLLRSLTCHSVMMANWYFNRNSDYFSDGAELKPLLHTWSLSVEEQFYVVLPVLMMLVYRYRANWMRLLLTLAFVISLSLAVVCVHTKTSDTFFLLPYRAWEMLAGALLAVYPIFKKELPRVLAEVMGWVGIAMILIPVLTYDKQTNFPGMAALPPVFGACLFIWSNNHYLNGAGKILQRKPLVFVGLISYSLYLWHWPIISYCNHLFVAYEPWLMAIQITLAFIFGYISWKYVETPFRAGFISGNKPLIYFGTLATVLMLVISVGLWKWTQPYILNKPRYNVLIDDVVGGGWSSDPYGLSGRHIGSSFDKVDFIVWGDSHAMALAPKLSDWAKSASISGRLYANSGRVPVTGLWANQDRLKRDEELRRSHVVCQAIIDSGCQHLMLISRWSNKVQGFNEIDQDRHTAAEEIENYLSDYRTDSYTKEQSGEVLRRNFVSMVEKFHNAGVKVWILKQVPETEYLNGARDFLKMQAYPCLNPIQQRFVQSEAAYDQRQNAVEKIYQSLQPYNVELIDVKPLFYSSGEPASIFAQRSYYRDDDHLTKAGVERFLEVPLTRFLERVKCDSKQGK